jgi:hypothetical protein
MAMRFIISCAVFLFLLSGPLVSQEIPNEEIRRRVESYKRDSRGPYKEIRWFCKDGTILPPQERCPEPGGVQRARHKDEVYALSVSNHVFLGQILATTPHPDFWDADNYHSRLKQFQLERYLRAIDNGWVLRKAQFYRGAFQVEDEARWGVEFYHWLLEDDRALESNYFLIRQSLKDVPHLGDDNLTQDIRTVSEVISDNYPTFLDLRVKIHGQPDENDLLKVERFRDEHKMNLDEDLMKQFDQLIRDLRNLYKPVDLTSLNRYLDQLPADSRIRKYIGRSIASYRSSESGHERIGELSGMLYSIREEIISLSASGERLAALDLSITLEELLMRELSGLKTNSIRENMEYIPALGMACAGCGYIEIWEWEALSSRVRMPGGREAPLEILLEFFETGRSYTEWGIAMFRAHYSDVIDLFGGFEPLANGFLDDLVRSSLLLYCGRTVDQMGDQLAAYKPASSLVMDIGEQHAIRGLNPGYAAGELVVISGQTGDLAVDREKIYIFNKPPPDLKPVAGIATVSEGNMVSHIQLLARNLGIPNAVISPQNLEDLKRYSGQVVFYAVSPGGTVVLKPFDQVTPEERRLIETRKRNQEKIEVPVHRIDLDQTQVIPLSQVSSGFSGILCGPKAANLGQLKLMFPDHVVEGIVIPFGIFRMHLDQPMPGEGISYWQHLNRLFEQADRKRLDGESEGAVDSFLLRGLEGFRNSIRQIRLQESFLDDLRSNFISQFGHEIGTQPVFLRSDTNMEDLKDFTGAGLNLTLFNVVAYESILQGIRDVWASPYTERSYQWRQQYLLNPENVFPSILIIPSVDVDCSGVMVTWGISNHDENDLTIAFNRGAGGAVEGQAAESYLVRKGGNHILLSPAREPFYTRLPESGGSEKHVATFEQPILSDANIRSLGILAEQVKELLPSVPGIETSGPFDIELGFKENKLWLFQVRPFVENKSAAASEYLNSLNPQFDERMLIPIPR